jgi:photosystem II oxygen-evolving enhancer protein 2
MKYSVRRGLLAVALVAVLTACSRSGDAPKGFVRFQDPENRFTLIHPDTWAFNLDPKGAVRLSDPADPTYQVSVVISDAPRKEVKDITAFGTPKQVADRFVNQVLKPKSPPGTKIELLAPKERRDAKGNVYYSFEIIQANQGRASHLLYCLSLDKGKVYTLVTGSSAVGWLNRQVAVYQIADSFQVS